MKPALTVFILCVSYGGSQAQLPLLAVSQGQNNLTRLGVLNRNIPEQATSNNTFTSSTPSVVIERQAPFRLIQGRVTDDNGSPIAGVSVNIGATNKGTTTNTNGEVQ